MDKLKKVFSGSEANNADTSDAESGGIISQFVDTSTLSWSTRVKGFVICFVAGVVCSMLGCAFFWLKHGIVIFCIFYTLGNIVALMSTCFLMGPMRQLKNMFAKTRMVATVVMLLSILLTIVAAILDWKALVLLFCIIEFLAMTWYSISYIPYARDACIKWFESCLG
ncbi:vesicle transport protein SFT2A-like [Pollicipes pollicipes]|uniref:vesicle transport protein SFT2A-like n=1 Tax=Pollicipes pollicipes TaxID=41117 RepID=UPI00188544A4|nr:vesicle transport protein SFT2A-like [Pollicipes pollicipes]